MEIHAGYLFVSLIQEGITIVSSPSFEYIGRQLFRQIEGFYVFEAVAEHFVNNLNIAEIPWVVILAGSPRDPFCVPRGCTFLCAHFL